MMIVDQEYDYEYGSTRAYSDAETVLFDSFDRTKLSDSFVPSTEFFRKIKTVGVKVLVLTGRFTRFFVKTSLKLQF